MFKYFIVLICWSISQTMAISQKNDYIWPMGNHGEAPIDYIENDSTNEWTPFSLDFNVDPMVIQYFTRRRMKMSFANAAFANDRGKLVCYTNGMHINGHDDHRITGGDTINFCPYWQYLEDKSGESDGFRVPQGVIILPQPGQDDQIILVTIIYNLDFNAGEALWSNTIQYDDQIQAKILSKDVTILKDTLKSGGLKAVRHANGRDWWLIAVSDDFTTFTTILIDPKGPKVIHRQKLGRYHQEASITEAAFSPDGSMYAVIDGQYWQGSGLLALFDFDRCSGVLCTRYFDHIPISRGAIGTGVVFSPDSKYLYINNDTSLYQYEVADMWKPRVLIDEYDGFQSFPHESAFRTVFGYWASGPDGRLYSVAGSGTSSHMHIMDYPNERGKACSFRQHALKIPNNPFSIPNFPNYRLGPLDGSPCDTLGIDNHPIAKYRYEADSIQYHRLRFTDLSYFRPETWSWDYGDGSPRESIQSPYHTFPKDGTYNVCLTVSNENSSNTSCRTITIGTSGTDDGSTQRADVSIFPNPVQDYLLVTLGEYVPAHGEIVIYDISGRMVKTQRIYYGQNNVDLRHLPTGVYVWRLMDGKVAVSEGKVVKE